MLTSGADVALYYGQGQGDFVADPLQDTKIKYGGGGAAVGLLLGVLIGSKLTFHSPVRRRGR